MTIVATSIPVLRVFFKQAVNTALSNYHNSSSRSKSKSTTASNPGSTVPRDHARRASKTGTHGGEHTSSSTESLVEDLERGHKREEFELEDLVVDEKTGRVTMKTPDSMPSTMRIGLYENNPQDTIGLGSVARP
jgi:hypothetical protein